MSIFNFECVNCKKVTYDWMLRITDTEDETMFPRCKECGIIKRKLLGTPAFKGSDGFYSKGITISKMKKDLTDDKG